MFTELNVVFPVTPNVPAIAVLPVAEATVNLLVATATSPENEPVVALNALSVVLPALNVPDIVVSPDAESTKNLVAVLSVILKYSVAAVVLPAIVIPLLNVAKSVNVERPVTVNAFPKYKLPAMPAPPATCNAPEVAFPEFAVVCNNFNAVISTFETSTAVVPLLA